MTKQELIERVAQRLDRDRGPAREGAELHKKTVALVIESVFAELGEYFIKARPKSKAKSKASKQAPRFTYPGFGTFTKKEKRARVGRDPRSGEAIEIPAKTTVGFQPGQDLKAELNRPTAPAKRASRRG
jgi:nucleoid DNA-binding protein